VPRGRHLQGAAPAYRLHAGWALAPAGDGLPAALLLEGDTVGPSLNARRPLPVALTDTLWTALPAGAEAIVGALPLPGPRATGGSAEARVAAVLVDVRGRLVRRGLVGGDSPFAVPALCDTLAAAAALAPEAARRALDGLARRRLLRRYGEIVSLCDRPNLARLAAEATGEAAGGPTV
jgi:hypothetical protein